MTKWSSEWDYDLESATEINIQWTGYLCFPMVPVKQLFDSEGIATHRLRTTGLYRQKVYDRRQFGWRIIHGNEFKLLEHGMLLLVLLCQGTRVFIMTFFFFIIVFAGIFIRNLILWMENSPAAVSFSTLASLLACCFGVSAPLTFWGVYFGKKEEFEFPVQTQETPLVCPKRSFFTRPTIILGSFLPFGCIFLQLPYILNRIWSAHMHYLLAFLLLVFLILMICCSEVTVLLCYFRLCAEDCGWWWRAFWTGTFTSIYVLLYAIHYFFTKLQVTGLRSTFVYFGYTLILMLAFFLFRAFFCVIVLAVLELTL